MRACASALSCGPNFNLAGRVSQMVADEFADMELKPEDIPDFEAPAGKRTRCCSPSSG
jgi:hypothetical protein